MGQVVLVETPDMTSHGTLHGHGTRLPVQARRLQGRPVDRVVVGRQPLHPPRAAKDLNQPVQPFALRPRTTATGHLTPPMDSCLVHLAP